LPRTARSTDRISFRELRQRLRTSRAATNLGFELIALKAGHATVRLRVEDQHRQMHGLVHGGVLAALADTAGGMATYSRAPRDTRVATIELKINFLEAVDGGILLAHGRVLRIGKHISVVDCELREKRRLIAKALITFFVGAAKNKQNGAKRSAG